MTMWGAGSDPAQPSRPTEPVMPGWSDPTGPAHQPPLGDGPVVPKPPADLGPGHVPAVGSAPVGPRSLNPEPVYPSAVGSAPVVAASSGPTGAAYGSTVVVRRPRWVVPALAVMGTVTLAALTVASWALVRAGLVPGGGPDAGGPTLAEAHEACGSRGELSDEGRTLYLDMEGEDLGSGTLTWSQVQCYLTELGAPDYVLRHMESTRALDGRQSDTWGDFDASWTYHPDDGLDVLIRQIT